MGAHHGGGEDLGHAGVWLKLALALAALLTVIGVIGVWPDGAGQAAAAEQAASIGLASERIPAVVASSGEVACSWSTPDDQSRCVSTWVIPESGPDAGERVELPELTISVVRNSPVIVEGESLIVGYEPLTGAYFYADHDRRVPLFALAMVFGFIVLVLGRTRGALALVAMGFTVVVLVGFVAPSVLDGNDPVLVSVVAASVIAFVTLYLTHGLNVTSSVALLGTLGALLFTLAISVGFFAAARFTGLASEDGLVLPILSSDLNVASLMLGGAILGALGALDDVTVTQAATIAELRRRNPDLSRRELFASGIRVGREHIAATVNTLLLAYAGASMPLLLLFVVSQQPMGMVLNSELVAVEIVRTLVGSIGLIGAVPVTTWLAAVLLSGVDHGSESAEVAEPQVEARWEDFEPQKDVW